MIPRRLWTVNVADSGAGCEQTGRREALIHPGTLDISHQPSAAGGSPPAFKEVFAHGLSSSPPGPGRGGRPGERRLVGRRRRCADGEVRGVVRDLRPVVRRPGGLRPRRASLRVGPEPAARGGHGSAVRRGLRQAVEHGRHERGRQRLLPRHPQHRRHQRLRVVRHHQQPDQRAERGLREHRLAVLAGRHRHHQQLDLVRDVAGQHRRAQRQDRAAPGHGGRPQHLLGQPGRRAARLGDLPQRLRERSQGRRRRHPLFVDAGRLGRALQPRRHRDPRGRALDGAVPHVPGRL